MLHYIPSFSTLLPLITFADTVADKKVPAQAHILGVFSAFK